jgi:DegV family protein with EDD domain
LSEVRIVTDSSALFLSPKLVKEYNIVLVPAYVHFGDEIYQLGVDISHEEVLHRIQAEAYLPRVTAPRVEDFFKVYQQLNHSVTRIISIHSATQLSAACRNAQAASQMILGRCDVAVIDSQTMDLGLGLITQKAAQMAFMGMSQEETVRQIRVMLGRLYCMYYAESMETLCHNNFVGKAQTILGSMLGIKPFVTIEEGELMVIEKAQTVAQAVDKLAEFASEFNHIDQMAVLTHTYEMVEPIRLLQDRLALDLVDTDYSTLLYGAMTATTIGPDAVGIVILETEEKDDTAIEDTLDDDDF